MCSQTYSQIINYIFSICFRNNLIICLVVMEYSVVYFIISFDQIIFLNSNYFSKLHFENPQH